MGVGGRLGRGIYLSSIVSKCLTYSKDRERGVIFGAQAILGNVQVTTKDVFLIDGYDSARVTTKADGYDPPMPLEQQVMMVLSRKG